MKVKRVCSDSVTETHDAVQNSNAVTRVSLAFVTFPREVSIFISDTKKGGVFSSSRPNTFGNSTAIPL